VTRALLVAGLAVVALVTGVRPHGSDPGVLRDATFAGLPNAASRVAAATAWCGTASQADRASNAVAGNPVHWVYLLPSDGQDQLASVASVMQADAEQIDGWWRGQDPMRTPRNDLARFSCGTQLDVTVVRSSRSGAQLAPLSGRFASLSNTVEQSSLGSPFTKVVAYYDGPSADETCAARVAATRLASRWRSSTPGRASASPRLQSWRTSSCTRSAPSRRARRTSARGRTPVTRATTSRT
jgi:hypothetical protein